MGQTNSSETPQTTLVPIASQKQKVFILWDYENIGRVMGSLKLLLIALDNLRTMALKYGDVKSFTCFFRPGEGDAETKQALQDMGLLIHEVVTQRRESVDITILTELIHISVKEKSPFTVFLLSSDRDFSRAISLLSSRGHHTVVVYKNGSTSEIAKQVANESIEWATLLPKLDETQKRLLQQALISLFQKNYKLSRPALENHLNKIKHSFGYANTWSFIKFLQDWDMLLYDSKSKTYSLPREVKQGEFSAPSLLMDEIPLDDTPSAADIQLYITLFETIISKLKKDALVPRELFVIGHFEDMLQNGDLVYAQLFKEYTPEEAYKRFITSLIMGQYCNVDNSKVPRILWYAFSFLSDPTRPSSGPYTAIDPYEPTERLYNSQMTQLNEFVGQDHLWRSIDNMFDLGQYLIEKGPKFFRDMSLGYVLEQAQLLLQRKKRGLVKLNSSGKKTVSDSGFILKQEEAYKSPASQILKLISKASSKQYNLSPLKQSANNNTNTVTPKSNNKRKNDQPDNALKKFKTTTEETEEKKKKAEERKQKREENRKKKQLQKIQQEVNRVMKGKKVEEKVDASTLALGAKTSAHLQMEALKYAFAIPDNPQALFEPKQHPKSKKIKLHLDLHGKGFEPRLNYINLLKDIAAYFHLAHNIKIDKSSDTVVRAIGTVANIVEQTNDISLLPSGNHWMQNRQAEDYTAMLLVNKLHSMVHQPGFEKNSMNPQGVLNVLKYQLLSICKQRALGKLKLEGSQQPDGQWNVQVSVGHQVETLTGPDPVGLGITVLQHMIQKNKPTIPLIDLNAVDEPEITNYRNATQQTNNFNNEVIDLSD